MLIAIGCEYKMVEVGIPYACPDLMGMGVEMTGVTHI